MLDVAYKPMAAVEFLAWAESWAEGERCELDDGKPVRMALERARHALAKGEVYAQLRTVMRSLLHGLALS